MFLVTIPSKTPTTLPPSKFGDLITEKNNYLGSMVDIWTQYTFLGGYIDTIHTSTDIQIQIYLYKYCLIVCVDLDI